MGGADASISQMVVENGMYFGYSSVMKSILHLDMNSYFATVEQQVDPQLRDRPVGVVKGVGRTCIIAASKEAKKYGVKTGANTWEALKLCPSLVLIPAHMERYLSVTKKLIKLTESFTPTREVFSIDEMFLDITQTESLFTGGAIGIALELKEKIRQELGEWLTCSIGISYSKILAKLASEQIKPDGLFVIDPENLDRVLAKVSLGDVCGIGWRIEKRLRALGISNLLQIRKIPLETLLAEFGEYWSEFLTSVAWGKIEDNVVSVEDMAEQKSVSRTYTTHRELYREAEITGMMRNLCEEVAWKLRKMQMKARCFGLAIRGGHVGDFKRKTVQYATDDGRDIFDITWSLFREMKWQVGVRFVGIWGGSISSSASSSSSLFESVNRKNEINKAIDRVNEKWGYLTMYPARVMFSEKTTPEPNGFLGDKKFQLQNG